MSFKIVKDWTTEAGYRAVVILAGNGSHHCGYVGITSDHPLHNVSYTSAAPPQLENFLDDKPIGKRGMIDVFCLASGGKLNVGILFDVHGGITYTGGGDYPVKSDGLWWFGYDCAHCDDKTAHSPEGVWRDEAYCVAECESLADQLRKIESAIALASPAEGGK